jgi:hypothetical protein
VLATTKSGDQDNKLALGAHSDSVAAGPGINDDGSGTIGILEVAKALSKYQIKNAVTFGFWSAEEEGLLGSTYYVENLPAAEAAKIRAYLNFDMVSFAGTFFLFEIVADLGYRLPPLTTLMLSTTGTAVHSTCPALPGRLRLRRSSRIISARRARTPRLRPLMDAPTTGHSSMLVSRLVACSRVLRKTRPLRKPFSLEDRLVLLWTSATTRLVITSPT